MRWSKMRWLRLLIPFGLVIIISFSLFFIIIGDERHRNYDHVMRNQKKNDEITVKKTSSNYHVKNSFDYYYDDELNYQVKLTPLKLYTIGSVNSQVSNYAAFQIPRKKNAEKKEKVVNHPFKVPFYLRRTSTDLPASEWRSHIKDNQLLDIADYDFLINNSHICLSQTPFLVALVHSSPFNFLKRSIIRRTWGSLSSVNGLVIKVIFIIGLVNDKQVQQKINYENDLNSDMVQAKFYDSYYNLTYKHLSGYKWLLKFCNQTRFVMKSDDDAFIDLFKVVKVLKTSFDTNSISNSNQNSNSIRNQQNDDDGSPKNIIACSIFPDGTLPKRQGKWSLSTNEYPFETYPKYCSGVAYFLTPDVLFDLYEAAHHVNPVLRIDDVFLTGIVAAVIRLNHLPLNYRYTYQVNKLKEWLYNQNNELPSNYMIGDIGDDINGIEWEKLMINLWNKTVRVWTSIERNFVNVSLKP